METKLIHESFLLFIVSMKYCDSCENISIFYSIVSNQCNLIYNIYSNALNNIKMKRLIWTKRCIINQNEENEL
jgi:hypothetical protein